MLASLGTDWSHPLYIALEELEVRFIKSFKKRNLFCPVIGMRMSLSGGFSIGNENDGKTGREDKSADKRSNNQKGLIRLLCSFNKCSPGRLHQLLIKRYHRNIQFLNTLDIFTSYLKTPMHIIPHIITFEGADHLPAYCNHRSRISVKTHFFCKHKITLRYPNLPCIGMLGGKNHISFHPIECLKAVFPSKDDSVYKLSCNIL